MRWRPGLVFFATCALAGCGEQTETPASGDAGPPPHAVAARKAEAQSTPTEESVPARELTPLDERIEGEIRRHLHDRLRAMATPLVLRDDTPRWEVVEKEDLGEDWTVIYFRGASVHLPLRGLERATLVGDERGFGVALAFGRTTLTIIDATGSAWTEATTRQRARLSPDFWEDEAIWSGIEDAVRRASSGPSEKVEERLTAYEKTLPRWSRRLAPPLRRPESMARAALSADPADPGPGLYAAYATARLAEIKASLADAVPGPRDVPLSVVAAGPTFGIMRGQIDAGPAWLSLSGADGMQIEVRIDGGDGLDAATRRHVLASFRPFAARKRVEPEAMNKAYATGRPAWWLLVAMSRLAQHPTPEKATALLRAAFDDESKTRDPEQLVEVLGAWVGATDAQRGEWRALLAR